MPEIFTNLKKIYFYFFDPKKFTLSLPFLVIFDQAIELFQYL